MQDEAQSDQDLIRECLNGSPSALARLWLRYDRMVYGTALGILCSRENAEDIRQEVFLKVHDRLPGIRTKRRRPPRETCPTDRCPSCSFSDSPIISTSSVVCVRRERYGGPFVTSSLYFSLL